MKILTRSCAGDRTSGRQSTLKATLLLILLVMIQGCTNSKLIIGPLYNRLDDGMRKEFNKLGDFNAEQVAMFEATLGNFHVWHRQSELPEYAALMKSVADSVGNTQTTADDVQQWFSKAERHSMSARECHPVNYLFDFMKTLTDDQLDYIEKRFVNQQTKNRQESSARTPEERIQSRLKNITKWAGRVGLDFTPTQRAIVLSTLSKQHNLSEEYYRESGKWNKQFFTLARDQDNPDYDVRMRNHLSTLWRAMETNYPDKWQANRDLWKKNALRFEQSMTPEQRASISTWLNKMASTLLAISEDKPSFQYVHDASLGCLIEPDKT